MTIDEKYKALFDWLIELGATEYTARKALADITRESEYNLLVKLSFETRTELATETGLIEVKSVRQWLQDKAFTRRHRN